MRARIAVGFAAAVFTAGCGGSDSNGGGAASPSQVAHGKQVFADRCGSCHTLKAAGTRGGVGPNLDEVKPDEATVKTTVANGRGVMPAFKGQLPAKDIDAVAQFVAHSAGR
jgi:cytochrome c6